MDQIKPFGEESGEHEVAVYKEAYHRFFFREVPFLDACLDTETYMIIGRRGSGKTSISNFYGFQDQIKNASCIDVNEPEVYTDVLSKISVDSGVFQEDLLVTKMVKVWQYAFWTMVFGHYQDDDPAIKSMALTAQNPQKSPAHLIRLALEALLEKFVNNKAVDFATAMEAYFKDRVFEKAVEAVVEISARKPLIIAMDSLERYDVENDGLMSATSALIQFASDFNLRYAHKGLHLKVFVSAEVYPTLREKWITNLTKFVRRPLLLHWRPKDLARLICWRLAKYLESDPAFQEIRLPDVDWDDFKDVKKKVWETFFGREIQNGGGTREHSFPYLLRHTQLRPRQIVVLCNDIALKALQEGNFPFFSNANLVSQTRRVELDLADEVIGSYAKAYKNIGEILDALTAMPALFKGNELDKVAHRTKHAWPYGTYSVSKFRRLVTELGIVGMVRSRDEQSRIIQADFEYAQSNRLFLPHDAECVIHPMFFRKFNIRNTRDYIIYPFPDHPDFQELGE